MNASQQSDTGSAIGAVQPLEVAGAIVAAGDPDRAEALARSVPEPAWQAM
jgi:hypothetical protein